MSSDQTKRLGIQREDALAYHSAGRPGKIEVVPTKPTVTQRDLSLAYTPGVAQPCLDIAKNPSDVYKYTAKGNLVAVISNGTAVLGLGDIGAAAGKPVMEGKGVLFKRFADIDVFDLELDTHDPEEFINAVKLLEPTFGGINLEDIKAPECFEIEERLQSLMNIPVFHDDQHGTAIISAAAFVNALEIAGKDISKVRVVVSGAGAAAFGCLRLYLKLGLRKENVMLVDSKGVIHSEREEGMTDLKREYALKTGARSLADAMKGADAFIGLSVGGLVTPDMVRSMAKNPIVFAMANPDPEIGYEEAKEARPDVIMATGRSDYPNQVNNVLGFPFIFRGALDCRATAINDEMKLAASHALASLARMDVPDAVLRAYSVTELSFGRDYLIPKPFDYRVLLHVPVAVAEAAARTGVAREPIRDYDEYRLQLESKLGRSRKLMHIIFDRAKRSRKRIAFPEGDHEKIARAAKILIDDGIADPILLGREEQIRERLRALDVDESRVTVIDPEKSDRLESYARHLHDQRRRSGVTLSDARKLMLNRNYFGMMMLESGDADGVISGLTMYYPETIKPALQVVRTREGVNRASGAYILMFKGREMVLADTTVNIEPTAEDLVEIALQTAETARRFGIEPRVAMLSFSNFGSTQHPLQDKVRRAVEILHARAPELLVEGEMQADTALVPEIAADFPWSSIQGDANVLIFPDLQSANLAYKLLWRLANAEVIGPILQGLSRPVHVLQRGVDVNDIVNMAAIAVLDAQELDRVRESEPKSPKSPASKRQPSRV
ncbi:MAG TPA: NADP-dependent malic enzyme [Thermoanaerobaculia bacterium]|nr:NADP-dependent malic enzyme [Thermoanaerobaculia bacterium]